MSKHIHIHYGGGRRAGKTAARDRVPFSPVAGGDKEVQDANLGPEYAALVAKRDTLVAKMEQQEDTGVTVLPATREELAQIHKDMAKIVAAKSK